MMVRYGRIRSGLAAFVFALSGAAAAGCEGNFGLFLAQLIDQANCPIIVNEPPEPSPPDYDTRWAQIEAETIEWPAGTCGPAGSDCPCSGLYYYTGACDGGEYLYIKRTNFMFESISYYDIDTREYVGCEIHPESPQGCGTLFYLREIDCRSHSPDASRCTPRSM